MKQIRYGNVRDCKVTECIEYLELCKAEVRHIIDRVVMKHATVKVVPVRRTNTTCGYRLISE